MKTVCKSIFTGCLAGMFALVAVATTVAQSAPEPAVVVSIAPVKEQMKDIKYLVDASGYGQMWFLIKSQIKYATSGIDINSPAGVFLTFEGDNPVPNTVISIPVSNIDDMLDTVANFADVDDEEDIMTITPPTGETLFAIEQGSHVFLSPSEEALKNLPEDPKALLGDMPTKYNLAAHVYGNRVPDELMQKAIDMIKDGYVDSLRNMGGDPEMIDSQIEDFEEQIKMLSDVDELVVGMVADEESHTMAMDFTITGKPGSKVAKSYAGFAKPDASRFAGFMNDKAAIDYNLRFDVNPEDSEQIGRQMDSMVESVMTELDNDGEFTEEEMDTIRNAMVQIGEVVEGTFKNGRIDSGGHLMMGENDFNFAAGGEVSEPAKIESAAKELVGLLQEKAGDVFEVKFDFAKVNGLNMHEIVFKVPEDEEEMQDYLGPEIVMLLGIGDKDVYFAAGKNPMETLKAAMAASDAAAPEYPVIYNIRVTPFLEYFASTSGEPLVEALFERMSEVGRDKITFYSKAIENGLFSRMEMQDGPLALIETAVQEFQAQMGGAGGPEF